MNVRPRLDKIEQGAPAILCRILSWAWAERPRERPPFRELLGLLGGIGQGANIAPVNL